MSFQHVRVVELRKAKDCEDLRKFESCQIRQAVQYGDMAISIDTLRKLAAVDPFKDGQRPVGRRDKYLDRLDEAGLLPYMARLNTTGPDLKNYLFYYQSKDGREYRRDDIWERSDSTKITQVAIKRMAKEDPDLASEYQQVLAQQGGAAVFHLIAAEVRRHDLSQLATPRPSDLASPEEALTYRNRGRMM